MKKNQLNIAMVAHDNKKQDMLEWIRFNKDILTKHSLIATGQTGTLVENIIGKEVLKLKHGPLGGDQELGSKIVNGQIDILIFFWDGLDAHPHDVDVKALLRLCVVWNLPTACNRATADMLISSSLFNSDYKRQIPKYPE